MAFLVISSEESGGAALVAWISEQRTMRDMSLQAAREHYTSTVWRPKKSSDGAIMKLPLQRSNRRWAGLRSEPRPSGSVLRRTREGIDETVHSVTPRHTAESARRRLAPQRRSVFPVRRKPPRSDPGVKGRRGRIAGRRLSSEFRDGAPVRLS